MNIKLELSSDIDLFRFLQTIVKSDMFVTVSKMTKASFRSSGFLHNSHLNLLQKLQLTLKKKKSSLVGFLYKEH